MLKVVVVDDYPLAGQAIEFLLKKNRPEVQYIGQALSGEGGFELISKNTPDIAFVDIKMPGMNGLELSMKIMDLAINTKIVFVSAYDDFVFVQSALRLGARDYLLKPIKREELFQIIDQTMAEKKGTGKEVVNAAIQQNELLLLREQLLLAIQNGDSTISAQACADFWKQLLLDTQNNPLQIRGNLKSLVNTIQQLVVSEDCVITGACREVLEYTCQSLSSDLSTTNDILVMENIAYSSVERCTNIYNESLNECGYAQIVRAKELIEENLNHNITLESIAQDIFISPFYLSRMFKKRTGINFLDYLITQRIKRAKTLLLTTNETIESIAIAVGYEEPNSFRRLFKKRVGMSASEYRQQGRQTETKDKIEI